jgi:hypothetical protein
MAVDIWSAGCVIGELVTGGPELFHTPLPGSEASARLLETIGGICGDPTDESWPTHSRCVCVCVCVFECVCNGSRVATHLIRLAALSGTKESCTLTDGLHQRSVAACHCGRHCRRAHPAHGGYGSICSSDSAAARILQQVGRSRSKKPATPPVRCSLASGGRGGCSHLLDPALDTSRCSSVASRLRPL